MTKSSGYVALLLGGIVLLFASGAQAGMDAFAGNGLGSLQRLSPVEKAQYDSSGNSSDGDDNCWDLYQTNCPTPHDTNPIQDLGGDYGYPGYGYPAVANHYRGAPEARLRPGGAPISPGLEGGGVPALHHFGGAGAGFHGLGSSGVPAYSRFMGYAPPAFHSFGGGEGFHGFGGAGSHGFGGAGEFHGGGALAFPSGGHGGIGHR